MESKALTLKKQLNRSYFFKGITVAVVSGMCYGLYTAFVTKGMGTGVWGDWYGDPANGAIVMVLLLGALGSAVNDSISAIWCLIIAAIKGKLGDFGRCLRTKPGRVMILCALAGGPIASTAYLVSLQMAGSMIIPITALCPAIGAIMGRVIFKQALTPRMMTGVIICVGASILIGSTSFGEAAPEGALVGCLIALIAAFGWGLEGCIAGFGTTLIDYEIGITIRQTTSGLSNLIILVPVIGLFAHSKGIGPEMIGAAFSDGPAMLFFIISGFFALFAFSLWYKGNSMCGAALGMACNGAYSFWGPFFCWIVLGLFFKEDGWMLPPVSWIGAIVMFFGILLIAVNPFAPLMKSKRSIVMKQPFYYAILIYFTKHADADADEVMEALKPEYDKYRNFTRPAVIEALMTAKENGLLEESDKIELVGNDRLRVWYKLSKYGGDMIKRFL